jgi:hypothetical protein
MSSLSAWTMTVVKISRTWLVRKKIVDFTFHPNNSLGIKASAKKYRTDRQSIYNWRNRIDTFEASIAHLKLPLRIFLTKKQCCCASNS